MRHLARNDMDGRLPRVAELPVEERDTVTTPLQPGFSLRLDALCPEQG